MLPGAALLVVLLIVIAITVASLGFLSRSNVELACGQNMLLRCRMDYLAESGLEHAKGLILNPQDLPGEYPASATAQQLAVGNDYYDVNVVRLGPCDYRVSCDAYRQLSGQRLAQSSLTAELHLDPVVAMWLGSDCLLWPTVGITGDVLCDGSLNNSGIIDGDVFANSLTGTISGRVKAVEDLPLAWPRVTPEDFTAHYAVQSLDSVVAGLTYGPQIPPRVYHRHGDLRLAGNVQLDGMLIVEGDLVAASAGNIITAGKNVPALLVTGDLVIEPGGELEIYGLALVQGDILVSGGAGNVDVHGGLFTQGKLWQVVPDASGNNRMGLLMGGPRWVAAGHTGDALQFDGSDDTVEDPTAGDYLNGLSEITVSLWVKSDVTGRDRGIMFTRQPTGADEELGIRYDGDGAFGGGQSCIKASVRTTSGYTQIESSSNVQTTEWQHLALVWHSGSSLRLYINGQLDTLLYDRGPVGGVITGVQKLMLGRGTKGAYWDGLIDDVRIYDRAAAEAETFSYPSGQLLVHWQMDGQDPAVNISAEPGKTAILFWSETGQPQKWSQAAGAFYRSIERR